MMEVIPESHRDAVARAIRSAFGRDAASPFEPVRGGASGALAFRTLLAGQPRLIRIESRRAWRNPAQDDALAQAAGAGIAPPLHWSDPATGIVIMDFIETQPLNRFPGGNAALARAAGALIGKLQAETSFQIVARYPEVVGTLLDNAIGSGRFAAGLLDAHKAGFARVCEAYPWDDAARVSAHNDPNPRNWLFDGKRLWLVDWETAFSNDPAVDLAILTLELAAGPDLETALLEGWQGAPPDRGMRARVTVMRQLTRLYYAGLLLSSHAATTATEPVTQIVAPSAEEFRSDVVSGRLPVGSPQMIFALAKISLAEFIAGFDDPHVLAALDLVAR